MSRVLRFNNYIVITNFKCLFTSLNNANPDDKFAFRYPTQHLPKIFLYRHTPNKLISIFLNFGVELPNRHEKWLMKIFTSLKGFDLKEYETYLENDDIISAFKMFLHALPYIKPKNGHLEPQYTVLSWSGYTNPNILLNSNDPEAISALEREIHRKIPVNNATSKESKKRLMDFLKSDTKYLDLINAVYQDDAHFFKKYRININTIYESSPNTKKTQNISANNTTPLKPQAQSHQNERSQNQVQKSSNRLHSHNKQDKTAQTEA